MCKVVLPDAHVEHLNGPEDGRQLEIPVGNDRPEGVFRVVDDSFYPGWGSLRTCLGSISALRGFNEALEGLIGLNQATP